jgi:4-hydroxybenzoate polyprenyltransferase
LPNVFTAIADVAMGYLVTHGDLEPRRDFAVLVTVSCLLYLSGIVLNDVFDAAVDAVEQPGRPIPSQRVSHQAAAVVGWSLLAGGLAVAWLLSFDVNDWRPGAVATLLAVCILLYNGGLKRTRLGPMVMGECRLLNVLLGMSLMVVPWYKREVLIALGIGIYVMGVTMFARTDAHESSRRRLMNGMMVLVAGILILAGVPAITRDRPPIVVSHAGWYLLWSAIGLIIARRCVMAVFEPSSKRVQAAVRHCVHAIIVLDAAVCVGYASPYWGFAVLSLLFPTIILTMWLNAT